MGQPREPTTLDRLVHAHLAEALRFATRLTGDLDAAEDLVQDALVRVARSWKTFRGESHFRTWLFRIVINVFRDSLPQQTASAPLSEELADIRADDPGSVAEAEELQERIAARISALPPRQREVLVLITYEGLDPREVADLLGVTEANVYSTLHVARRKLRSELAAWLGEKNDA